MEVINSLIFCLDIEFPSRILWNSPMYVSYIFIKIHVCSLGLYLGFLFYSIELLLFLWVTPSALLFNFNLILFIFYVYGYLAYSHVCALNHWAISPSLTFKIIPYAEDYFVFLFSDEVLDCFHISRGKWHLILIALNSQSMSLRDSFIFWLMSSSISFFILF